MKNHNKQIDLTLLQTLVSITALRAATDILWQLKIVGIYGYLGGKSKVLGDSNDRN